ncbi:MAG: ATP-dependent DNA ligase [Mesorhizobium sp.]|uniref:non-homologous end-joining DNA ligase n=1 Tax=Mesorhizobium sp. TaxID=1871066 RepID=UPI000FE4EE4F|nr:non-homologous end-joining DNA ligase [Mesorhizobium sp.]RWG50504.1 MAG: ATP-dependent DNA ligase [Mesorhizobium sp.]RWL05262.1 MAG: ATP-dependent DNA ligase [Mesorhizobium sp.]TIN10284.1 MAG: ATP-dependent DNA ligase [Mesorhizobium sp.]TIQ62108.1 MAG: ATP-dependent DNA ligase [Mesorhizobium sp.]
MKWARRTTSARDRPSIAAGVIPPLLPTLVDRVPQGPHWLHEIKWDGYRIGVYLDKGKVKILTRNLHDWTVKFPTIVAAVAELDATDAIIDGEAFVADDKGLSHFSSLQRALGRGGRRQDIMLAVFDLLKIDGEDLRDRPLVDRRKALVNLLGKTPPNCIVLSDEISGGSDILAQVCQFGFEGIVSKLRISPYRSGRRQEWVKTKCVLSDEFIVIGYEPGNSYGGLGSVLLANVEDGNLVFAGGVGTGFNARTGPEVKRRLDAIQMDKPPIPGLKLKGAVWTRPEIVIDIEYRGWTEDHQLRHPSFKGIREDRSVDEFL